MAALVRRMLGVADDKVAKPPPAGHKGEFLGRCPPHSYPFFPTPPPSFAAAPDSAPIRLRHTLSV